MTDASPRFKVGKLIRLFPLLLAMKNRTQKRAAIRPTDTERGNDNDMDVDKEEWVFLPSTFRVPLTWSVDRNFLAKMAEIIVSSSMSSSDIASVCVSI